jgi:hypothetical protein
MKQEEDAVSGRVNASTQSILSENEFNLLKKFFLRTIKYDPSPTCGM